LTRFRAVGEHRLGGRHVTIDVLGNWGGR